MARLARAFPVCHADMCCHGVLHCMEHVSVKLQDVTADVQTRGALAHKFTGCHTIVEAAYRGSFQDCACLTLEQDTC